MHIRYLTAMLDMASDKTSTLPFPLPIDPLAGLRDGGLRDLLAGGTESGERPVSPAT